MQFEVLSQIDGDDARVAAFAALVRAGPWQLASLDGLFARDSAPLAAVLVHDEGPALAATLERTARERNQVAVIGYREAITPAAVVDALHAGAVDYLAWPLDPETLSDRLQLAARRASRRMRKIHFRQQTERRLDDLSKRQRQVFDALVRGKMNKETAWDLGISERTVEAHRRLMLSKLGLKTSMDAVSLAASLAAVSESRD